MRAWEARTWAAGVAQDEVIRAAGRAVATVVRRRSRVGAPVLVLAGRGHNGDDAAVAAGELDDRDVLLVRVQSPGGAGLALDWLERHAGRAGAVVVDGMFGIGLSRPIAGECAEVVSAVHRSGLEVVAVDVPSGVDADRGVVMGTAVEAAITVTLGAVKRGLLEERVARYVGRLELAADIGLVGAAPVPGDDEAAVLWTVPGDFEAYPPRRPAGGHKGTFGHVAIVAGSEGYHGAAVLAALGALRARPGLVTVYTDERCYVPVASQLRAAMVRPWRGERIEANGHTAVVVGPGLASARLPGNCRTEVARLWREARCPVVGDATALDWLPERVEADAGLRVVTPHPGEAGRLLGVMAADIQADRCGAVRRLSGRWVGGRTVVVLKGRHTLVGGGAMGFAEGIRVNSSGNSGLGQGGTGDVLAGYLGGLLAQSALAAEPLQAVRYGVWRHGWAADRLEETGGAWTVDDLVAALGVA
jgi:NAD(P)H-hydrate epimerase